MASQRCTEPKSAPEPAVGYFAWSRDPAAAVFAVLPLWLLYEVLRLTLAPAERNAAEALVCDALAAFGPHAVAVLRVVLFAAIVLAAMSIHRRHVPWARVALVAALEGAVYGVMLGPVTGALTMQVLDSGVLLAAEPMAERLIGSLSAALFEEAVFRLGVLSLAALLLRRACLASGTHAGFGIAAAVVVSAVAFSAFHHVGGGEPFRTDVFVFRAIAGVLLGVLFVLRGFGVCVYTHAVYDLHYYLTQGLGV